MNVQLSETDARIAIDDLLRQAGWDPVDNSMVRTEIPEHYIRQRETRAVRPYQANAMRALDHAFELGKRRFLIELPTGTGKTDLICLYLKRLLHLVLCRRVPSPILYQQMRGRGTRTAPYIEKRRFVIDDFLHNHLEGERIDKGEYVTYWEEMIRAQAQDDRLLQKVRDGVPLEPEEQEELARHLHRPERYFNESNLRRAYGDPGGNLLDFIRAALGRLQFKSLEHRLEESFRAWLVPRSLTPQKAEYLCLLKNRGIATGQLRTDDLFAPPLSILDAAGKGVELFGEEGLKQVVTRLTEDVLEFAS